MTASGPGDRFDTGRGGVGGWGGGWGWGADYLLITATRASIPASLACSS